MGNVLSRREKNKSKKGKREPIRERVGHFRMLMQGDGGVGKTALCTRFAHVLLFSFFFLFRFVFGNLTIL